MPAPSDATKYVQSIAPPLQGQEVEVSSVQLHDDGQAAADFFDRFSWKEIGLKHVPNGREEIKKARDGTPGPRKKTAKDGTPGPMREEPATENATKKARRCWLNDTRGIDESTKLWDSIVSIRRHKNL